ncbi:flagellin [Pleionea litopenaei]|uniref:Flagellin n=1 Tax=Pleionea litopenaei TaxID=3070815 RepID=A0AA51RU52_9GAMM|nr:flagellin [Pleionea sp. HL-JVS1]WMS87657.1 flagellin [Pleionea sp. HL-JVS1]
MGNVIATNIPSLNAQRNLFGTNSALQTSFQRLSSGFRINSAKDDAAGLQIANRLTSQIGGINAAVRNANDGISLSQTAEGALAEATTILQRIRDLAVQSANGSNGASERQALQQEVSQLQAELNRIADTTTFGGKKILDGTFGSQAFQVGSNANETVSVSIGSARGTELGLNKLTVQANSVTTGSAAAATAGLGAITVGGAFSTATTAGDGSQFKRTGGLGVTSAITATGTSAFAVNGGLGRAEITIAFTSSTADESLDVELSAKDIAAAINRKSSESGVSADARTVMQIGGADPAGGGEVLLARGTYSFRLFSANGIGVDVAATVNDPYDLSNLANSINQTTGETGVIAIADGPSLTIINENGDNIALGNVTFAGQTSGVTSAQFDVKLMNFNATRTIAQAASFTANGTPNTLQVSGQIQLNGGASGFAVSNADLAGHNTTNDASSLDSVVALSISTAGGAQSAIKVVDGAIIAIDSLRASLGSVQNRLESTISNLQNISENAAAARSRIKDTDYAQETANLAKNQVLQQAGLSILAQANSSSQAVLSLLQG